MCALQELAINKVETSVYRKATDTNIYIKWHSHVPSSWKIGTLRNLIKAVKLLSSSKFLLRNEMNYLSNIFREYNSFPLKVINNMMDQEFSQLAQQGTVETKNQHIL